jgi:hypothetical protein
MESVGGFTSPELQSFWDDEINARVGAIHSGAEKGIPAEEVTKQGRRALNEIRRLSSGSQ